MNHLQSALFHFLAFAFGVLVLVIPDLSRPWIGVSVSVGDEHHIKDGIHYLLPMATARSRHECRHPIAPWFTCLPLLLSPVVGVSATAHCITNFLVLQDKNKEEFWAEGEGSSTEVLPPLEKWITMPNNVHQTTLFAFCTTEHTQHNHLAVPSAYPYGLVIVSQPLMIIIMLPALLC
jgi:hypothetical protein